MVRACFVSTYPPRRCGVATFTHDLARSTGNCEIVALHPAEQQQLPYSAEVHHRIRRDEFGDYVRIARSVNDCVEMVSIQHDFAIWGGESGTNVLDFARALSVPAVATFHTVPSQPTRLQHVILSELAASVDAAVVISAGTGTLLSREYGVDSRKIEVIPHGVPDLPLVDSETIKPALELAGRKVILGFGLVGPNKGHELMFEALPAVVAANPSVLYAIVGPTHPDLLRGDGEAYRQSLTAQVERLQLGKHVRFVDRFVGRVEMTRWLEAADVIVTPYADLEMTVSGALTYAMGAGRAVVSTPFSYASEMLAKGRGVLVEPQSPPALAAALIELLGDDALRATLGRAAHDFSRGMVWSEVASRYRALFERVAAPIPASTGMPISAATA